MNHPYKLGKHLNRYIKLFALNDPSVPRALFDTPAEKPDLSAIKYPLPSRKDEYTCCAEDGNGVCWFGADNGLTRYDSGAMRKIDVIMYFSAHRDLPDNCVENVFCDGGDTWVLCKSGIAKIQMVELSGDEKADVLLRETLKYVDRRGMISQKTLAQPRVLDSVHPYGHSDNDGCFTAGFAIAEMFRYACMVREKGKASPEAREAFSVAVKACEACLLLMNISGRGDGFVARSYMTPDEPVPDDGLFFRKEGGKAVCLPTAYSRKRALAGKEIDAAVPVPERLSALYRSLGYSDDGIVYKGDTSSDEITLHFLQMLIGFDILGPEDEELAGLIKMSAVNTMNHIISGGYRLIECDGKPTTWAKWDEEYFNTGMGWADACLNSAEVLMYLKTVMHITGEKGKWQAEYDALIAKGYADLPLLHYDRFCHSSLIMGCDCEEELMYGDNMLAVASFWGLLKLEEDKQLHDKYEAALLTWCHTLAREHNPGYTFPLKSVCDAFPMDMEKIADWFYRTNVSRLAAGVSMSGRHDVPMRVCLGGYEETGWLLQPDERFISKYDRNPYEYRDEDSGGVNCVESCYVYTFAYWIGRYYGFISE